MPVKSLDVRLVRAARPVSKKTLRIMRFVLGELGFRFSGTS